jgi:CelD/BcsL family acetyltransferase involved in cellulose biosynthesis
MMSPAARPLSATVRDATDREWDEIAARSEHATYFHTRAWAELWGEQTGRRTRPVARLFTFHDGARAVVPAGARRLLRGRVDDYTSSATGKYGGWISDGGLTPAHARTIWELMARWNILLRMNPFDPLWSAIEPLPWTRRDFTQALDLAAGFESVWRGAHQGHRRAVQHAERAGVRVEPAEDARDWEAYYAVYQDSRARWGEASQSNYSRDLYRSLQRRQSDCLRLWVARFEGRVVSGAVCLYHNRHAVYWMGATLQEHLGLRASHLLHCEILRDACRRGLRWYDLNPSGGLAGVVEFKRRFGAREFASHCYRHTTWVIRVYQRMRGMGRRRARHPAVVEDRRADETVDLQQ